MVALSAGWWMVESSGRSQELNHALGHKQPYMKEWKIELREGEFLCAEKCARMRTQ